MNLVDSYELLLLFQRYVTACVEKSTPREIVRPVSFDEWYETEYLPKIDELTQVVEFVLQWEEAAGGYLVGSSEPESHAVRIPIFRIPIFRIPIYGDLRRLGRKFADKMNRRMPTVIYNGDRIYHWSWD